MPQDSSEYVIFISYRRREGVSIYAHLFAEQLMDHFGNDKVFIDLEGIEIGEDFERKILNALNSCEVLLAIIDRQWAGPLVPQRTRPQSMLTRKKAKRRIDDPKDFVRREIATALEQDKRVIPILVEGASMPRAEELPDNLKKIAHCNNVRFSDLHRQSDMEQLIKELQSIVDGAPAARLRRQRDAEAERLRRQAAEKVEQERRAAEGHEQSFTVVRSKDAWKSEAMRTVRIVVQLIALGIVVMLLPQSCRDFVKRTTTKFMSYASPTPTPPRTAPSTLHKELADLNPFAKPFLKPTPEPTPSPFRNIVGMEFVWIPSNDGGFYISKSAITNAQWKKVTGRNLGRGFQYRDPEAAVQIPNEDKAQAFIDKLNKIDKVWVYRTLTLSERLQPLPFQTGGSKVPGFRVAASFDGQKFSKFLRDLRVSKMPTRTSHVATVSRPGRLSTYSHT